MSNPEKWGGFARCVMRGKGKVLAACILSLFTVSFALIPYSAAVSANQQVNWDNVKVGDVIAHGAMVQVRGETACGFDGINGVTAKVPQGVARSIDLRTDSKCNLVVASK